MSSHHDWVREVVERHDLEKPFPPENGTPLQFKAGDRVIYTNPAGLEFRRRITGFYQPVGPCALYARGARYLIDSDSPWFPVKEASLRLDEHRAQAAQDTCTDCGAETSLVIGCPDGAEVCSQCFDAGAH